MTTAQFLLVSGIMIVFGVALGFVAGWIWKDNRPIGVTGDFVVAISACLAFGIGEWFLIPALGFKSPVLKLLGVFVEAPAMALVVLWLIRYIKK